MAKKIFNVRRSATDHRTHPVRTTQIEFQMECVYCKNLYWAKSRKAKFCSTNCRVLNHQDKNKAKAEKAKKPLSKEAKFYKARPQTKLKLKVPPIKKPKK